MPCKGIKFINQADNNACQEFFLDESVDPINPPLRQIKNGGSASNLLSDKFKIIHGNFILNGDRTVHTVAKTDLSQPKITLLFNMQTQTPDLLQEKIIQTTVSARNLNLP